ncbi:fasciclin domain-containing protein [Sphingobacterium humi]|nr:fasciclin domain-containing protein [Sphingobacterium humi]
MDSILEMSDNKKKFTVFIPSNHGLEQGGWTLESITKKSKTELIEFIQAHILSINIQPDCLQKKEGNLIVETNFIYPNILYSSKGLPYNYSIGLKIMDNQLFINGKEQGNLKLIKTKNGSLYEIIDPLVPPSKSAWELLQSDPEYSLYTQLMIATDSMYTAIFEKANGYKPQDGHSNAQTFQRNSLEKYHFVFKNNKDNDLYVDDLTTWFIPTNKAFHDLGFNSLDDLLNFNKKRGEPEREWQEPISGYAGFYGIRGEFATDTLLDYHHNWGLRFADLPYKQGHMKILVFSNDLPSKSLKTFPIAHYEKLILNGVHKADLYYLFPFISSNNSIKLPNEVHNAILTKQDVLTLNGIIQGVDRILVPDSLNIF